MSHKISILLVEDEPNICNFITATLSAHDYRVSQAHTGKDALSIITSQCPDLILLDLGLPDMDGMEIIRQVRTWASIPIIVISARIQEQEKVKALDLGADDYLTKPIGTSELLARIRTAMRHSNRLNTDSLLYKRPFRAKDLVIDFDKHLVTVGGQETHLTQNEFKIIALLAKNSGRVMTYDSIIENIWGPYADGDNSILRVNMAHIRRKIEKNPAEPEYIFTEIGIGYRMIEDEMNWVKNREREKVFCASLKVAGKILPLFLIFHWTGKHKTNNFRH